MFTLIQGETKKEQKKIKWGEEVTKGLHATVHLLMKMKTQLLLLNTTSIQTRDTQPPKCILLFKCSTIGANSSKA